MRRRRCWRVRNSCGGGGGAVGADSASAPQSSAGEKLMGVPLQRLKPACLSAAALPPWGRGAQRRAAARLVPGRQAVSGGGQDFPEGDVGVGAVGVGVGVDVEAGGGEGAGVADVQEAAEVLIGAPQQDGVVEADETVQG